MEKKRSRPGRPSPVASEKTRLAGRKSYWKNRDKRIAYNQRPDVIAKKREWHRLKRLAQGRRPTPPIPESERGARWRRPLLSTKSRAKISGIEFNLTTEWALATYTGCCSITGIPFGEIEKGYRGPNGFSPSIDRIDPSRGYVIGNCRFVLFAVNSFKGRMSDSQMLEIAKRIVATLGASCLDQKPVCIDRSEAQSGDLTAASRQTARELLNRDRVTT